MVLWYHCRRTRKISAAGGVVSREARFQISELPRFYGCRRAENGKMEGYKRGEKTSFFSIYLSIIPIMNIVRKVTGNESMSRHAPQIICLTNFLYFKPEKESRLTTLSKSYLAS